MRFRTVELGLVLPVSSRPEDQPGHGSHPHGATGQAAQRTETLETLRFSDAGYVDDTGVVYPPYVTQALDLTRSLTLTADALGGAFAVGVLALTNPSGVLDSLIQSRINDHLPVTIREGVKRWDATRGIWTDPPAATLRPVFAGLGRSWQPGLNTLSVTLLDATYWLDGVMPVPTYGGTGALDGDSNVRGRNLPRLRGQASNLTPVLIDSRNFVYQVSDAPARITALYEGGYDGGITFGGFVNNLYATSPNPGTYTVLSSSAGTWIRLGTRPVYAITLDAVGQFRSGEHPETVTDILRRFLIEDLVLPPDYIDPVWQPGIGIGAYRGGWYWDGAESVTGRQAVTTLLSGLGISLIPTRTGTLRPVQLSAPDRLGPPVATLNSDVISEITLVPLDASLDPPTWRWRIGWGHAFTVQTPGNGLHPQITPARQSTVSIADRAAVWIDTNVKSRWRVPGDPPLIATALTGQGDAQSVASQQGAIWGQRRRLWAVEVPQSVALGIELGDPVRLDAPVPGASGGVPGVVIGEHVSSANMTSTLTILV